MMAAKKKKVTKKSVTKKSATGAVFTKQVAKKSVAKKKVTKKSKVTGGAAPEGTSAPTLVGKKAPRFRLSDQSGRVISSDDFKGKAYVLYFYPKDNTPGCTQESCDFRDELRNFQKSGVTILGVSPDSEKSHAGFAEKYQLSFSLLSDPEKELAQAYGVWALKQNYGRQYWGIVRSTFLVDSSGKIKKEWRGVKVNGHAGKVLEEVRA
jgi:thioredoxin-dependent peroxiredoxin